MPQASAGPGRTGRSSPSSRARRLIASSGDITTFVPNPDGSWRRDSEHHENTLIDTAAIPGLLRSHGISARVTDSFGEETQPAGLRVLTGTRDASDQVRVGQPHPCRPG